MYIHDHARPFLFEGDGDAAVLLLHGWTGSPAHMRPLGAALHGAGYTVLAPALAGHATSLEDMAATGWRDWVASAGLAAADLRDRGKRLHLVGLSMGGVISLLMGPVFDAASVTTINAPQKVQRRLAKLGSLSRLVREFHEWEPADPPPGDGAEFWHQYAGAPTRAVGDLLTLIRASRKVLDRVSCPTLIIQSRIDETVRPVSARIIYDGVASRDKRIVWLDRSRHVSTLDEERHVIHGVILAHVAAADRRAEWSR